MNVPHLVEGKIHFYLIRTEQEWMQVPSFPECDLAAKLLIRVAVVSASTSHFVWIPTLAISSKQKSFTQSDKLILERGYGL